MDVTLTTDLGVLQIEDAQPAQVDRLLNYVSLHLASQESEDSVEEVVDDAVDPGYVDGFCWPTCWNESVKAIAKDSNGRWYAYSNGIPSRNVTKWAIEDPGYYSELQAKIYRFPEDVHWEDSLILNPFIDHEESQDAS